MLPFYSRNRRGVLLLTILVAAIGAPHRSLAKDKDLPTLRWAEDRPGCTFSRDRDGKYRYALWAPDYGVTLAVDSQELTLVQKRAERFFSLQLTVRYRGKQSLAISPSHAALEFVKHSRVIQASLDPENFVQRIQADLEQLEYETEREVKKHPEKREEKEKYVQAYQHDAMELTDFVNQHALPDVQLDSGNPEISGWVLFSTKNRWIGEWKRPEEFVLRIPVGEQMLEFPFMLPPKEGDLILRQRGN